MPHLKTELTVISSGETEKQFVCMLISSARDK